jgi:hypothetical protein
MIAKQRASEKERGRAGGGDGRKRVRVRKQNAVVFPENNKKKTPANCIWTVPESSKNEFSQPVSG